MNEALYNKFHGEGQLTSDPWFCKFPAGHEGACSPKREAVNHPAHYGGAGSPYEAIKVIEAWGLGFHLGNAVKYINRAGKKGSDLELEDLRKAQWYLNRYVSEYEKKLLELAKEMLR